jgi:hypothetical protein
MFYAHVHAYFQGANADSAMSAHYMLRAAVADEIRSRVNAVGGASGGGLQA